VNLKKIVKCEFSIYAFGFLLTSLIFWNGNGSGSRVAQCGPFAHDEILYISSKLQCNTLQSYWFMLAPMHSS